VRKLLLLLILLVAAALAEAPARAEAADAVILHYDSQGRVVGREEVAPRPSEASPDGTTPRRDGGERILPGELIVAAPGSDHALSFVGLGFTVIDMRNLDAFGLTAYRLGLPRSLTSEEAARRLHEAIPGLTIDRHHLLDPTAARGTALEQAGSLLDWTVKGTTCGSGLRLGMIDGAVDLSHPALAGRRITFRSFHDPDNQPAAADHGTAIAAILVGTAPWGGLLPEAELLAANIFERKAGGSISAKAFGLIKALD
jgi:subtilisin family serine protease